MGRGSAIGPSRRVNESDSRIWTIQSAGPQSGPLRIPLSPSSFYINIKWDYFTGLDNIILVLTLHHISVSIPIFSFIFPFPNLFLQVGKGNITLLAGKILSLTHNLKKKKQAKIML